jgi:hypothetical protein
MTVSVITIKEFKDKIKMSIPFHRVTNPPRIGDIEGQSFECGCGKSHTMNFDIHYFISDMGMFKAVFLSPACSYLNALKYRKMFGSGIENLFSTKFLKDKVNYGFDDYPDFGTAIKNYLGG